MPPPPDVFKSVERVFQKKEKNKNEETSLLDWRREEKNVIAVGNSERPLPACAKRSTRFVGNRATGRSCIHTQTHTDTHTHVHTHTQVDTIVDWMARPLQWEGKAPNARLSNANDPQCTRGGKTRTENHWLPSIQSPRCLGENRFIHFQKVRFGSNGLCLRNFSLFFSLSVGDPQKISSISGSLFVEVCFHHFSLLNGVSLKVRLGSNAFFCRVSLGRFWGYQRRRATIDCSDRRPSFVVKERNIRRRRKKSPSNGKMRNKNSRCALNSPATLITACRREAQATIC